MVRTLSLVLPLRPPLQPSWGRLLSQGRDTRVRAAQNHTQGVGVSWGRWRQRPKAEGDGLGGREHNSQVQGPHGRQGARPGQGSEDTAVCRKRGALQPIFLRRHMHRIRKYTSASWPHGNSPPGGSGTWGCPQGNWRVDALPRGLQLGPCISLSEV